MSDDPPKVIAALRMNDQIVGDIVINPDGSFEGRISDRLTHVLWVAYLRDGYSDSMSLTPNLPPAIKEGPPMSRNVFDGNSDMALTQEEVEQFGGKMHSLLPTLDAGRHYELKTLESGRVVVIVEQG